MPEGEPIGKPEGVEQSEVETRETTYSRDQLLEAMIVAKDLGGTADAAEGELSLAKKTQELLERYKIGTEPDFAYLSDVIDFVWLETVQPGPVGQTPEEAQKLKAELAANYTKREADFIKQAYARMLERTGPAKP